MSWHINWTAFHIPTFQFEFSISWYLCCLRPVLPTERFYQGHPSLQLAQAILIPFLVEQKNMGAVGLDAVRQMIDMSPPENRRVSQRLTFDFVLLYAKKLKRVLKGQSCSVTAELLPDTARLKCHLWRQLYEKIR